MLNNMMIADRVVSLGLLAAGMSHHIRNALVAVKTFPRVDPLEAEGGGSGRGCVEASGFLGSLLAKRPRSDRQDQRHAQGFLGRRGASGVGVLGPGRTGGRHEKCGGQTGAEAAPDGGEVDVRIPEDLPLMQVDRKKFERLFELLFEDELVFLPRGSRITVTADVKEGKFDEPEIRVEVRDNGPGLPQESLRTIFDPFSVRNNSPSEYGIRLMACFFIVHYHRGNIVAQSSEGKGTTFTMRLPVNPRGLPAGEESDLFLQKVQLNDEMWSKLLASS
jgi:hypothetical protein